MKISTPNETAAVQELRFSEKELVKAIVSARHFSTKLGR